MEFKDAEPLLSAAMLANYPPLMLVGVNQIGKTTLLETMASHYKNVKFTTGMDYGGLQQFAETADKRFKTIVLSDLQTVLARKRQVRESTFGFMSTMVEEGITEELVFRKFPRNAIHKKFGCVIGATPRHIAKLVREDEIDLMTRFLYVPVERTAVNLKMPFTLHITPFKKINKKIQSNVELIDSCKVKCEQIRYQKMINSLFITLLSVGIEVEEANRLLGLVNVFIPMEGSTGDWAYIFHRVLREANLYKGLNSRSDSA